MDFRLAEMGDLPRIKAVYGEIIKRMYEDGIPIWDDIFPCEFFQDDIENRRLYIALDGNEIVSAFALCLDDAGASHVVWRGGGKAVYLDRFGVNVNYLRKGVATAMLDKARETAKAMGAERLRLFVVDINAPAIRLYEKYGFERAGGVYDLHVPEGAVLREYGYEIAP